MKKGLIIASGNVKDLTLLEEQGKKHDYILCADGGIQHIYKLNIKVDAIIGDLDSVDVYSSSFIKKNNIPVIKFPVEKDETDTELAINYLVRHGFDDITLMGTIGTRLDHTMANMLLLKRLSGNNVMGKIIDDHNIIFFVRHSIKLEKKENHYISIIPITNSGAVVTLKGFYYPLENTLIEYGSTLGISNKIVDDIGEIFIAQGEVLVFESRD